MPWERTDDVTRWCATDEDEGPIDCGAERAILTLELLLQRVQCTLLRCANVTREHVQVEVGDARDRFALRHGTCGTRQGRQSGQRHKEKTKTQSSDATAMQQ